MGNAEHRDETAPALGFAIRLACFYGAIFLLVGSHLPYFPVWLDWRGLSADQIGIVLATPLLIRIGFTPLISFAADRIGNRRTVLIALAWGTLMSCLLFALSESFWTILAVAALFAVFWTSVMPLTEAAAMDGVRHGGLDYGRMRLWGSLTFIAASFGGGFAVQFWNAPAALWLLIAAAAAIVLGAHALPQPTGRGLLRAAAPLTRIRVRDAVALARSRIFLTFLLTTSCLQSAHAVYYTFGTLHWQSLGISTGVIGALWAIGVIAEITLFAFSGRAVAALGATALLWIAAIATLVRWAVTAFSPPLWLLFLVQALHGVTFGAAHLGAIHFIHAAVPDEAAGTAQGLYASVTAGLAMGGMFALAGPLYTAFGGQAYLAMAALGVIGGAGALALRRMWQGDRLIRLEDG